MKLSTFIPEIKIQSNSQPRDSKQLKKFVEQNLDEIIDKTAECFIDDDDDNYLFNDTKVRYRIIEYPEDNFVQIKNTVLRHIIWVFMNGEDFINYLGEDEHDMCHIKINGINLITSIGG